MRNSFVWISLLAVAFASAARGQEYRAEVITPPSGFVPFNFDDGVGRAVAQWPVGQETHAAVWGVAGGSVVDLQPAGYGLSTANASRAGQQAGYAFSVDGQTQRAMLWRATAASRVDLHPAGSSSSLASEPTVRCRWGRQYSAATGAAACGAGRPRVGWT